MQFARFHDLYYYGYKACEQNGLIRFTGNNRTHNLPLVIFDPFYFITLRWPCGKRYAVIYEN